MRLGQAAVIMTTVRLPDAASPKQKSSRFLGGALFFCAGCASSCSLVKNYDDPEGPRYSAEFAPPLEDTDEPLEELAVCSFNIEFAEDISEAIDDLSGDEHLSACSIVLLQEMDWAGSRRIAEALTLDVVYYPGSVHHDKDFGNAVLSRLPIVDDAKLILPHRNPTNGRIRIAVSATLGVPGAPVTTYSVHSDTPWLGPAGRLDQAEAIAIHAARVEGDVVVGGDFNTSDPGSVNSTVEVFTSRSFTWATRNVPPTGRRHVRLRDARPFLREGSFGESGRNRKNGRERSPADLGRARTRAGVTRFFWRSTARCVGPFLVALPGCVSYGSHLSATPTARGKTEFSANVDAARSRSWIRSAASPESRIRYPPGACKRRSTSGFGSMRSAAKRAHASAFSSAIAIG